MTVKECYEQMGADYEGVLGRLRSEVLIKKFAKKFLDDGSFQSLKDNLAQKNADDSCNIWKPGTDRSSTCEKRDSGLF